MRRYTSAEVAGWLAYCRAFGLGPDAHGRAVGKLCETAALCAGSQTAKSSDFVPWIAEVDGEVE